MQNMPNIQSRSIASTPSAAGAPAKAQSSAETPLAFRALIERLRDQAHALEQSSTAPLDARDLSGAVQAAQASLHDALSIADGLVEAYRSDRMQSSIAPPDTGR
jgi:hypothetical protein